jgi:hypothetical protein
MRVPLLPQPEMLDFEPTHHQALPTGAIAAPTSRHFPDPLPDCLWNVRAAHACNGSRNLRSTATLSACSDT